MSGPTTRKELYERIVSTSKDEVVLEEMIRLGFWPAADATAPSDPADEIRKIGELERKLQQLAGDAVRMRDPAAVKAELLKRRLAASREKRAATKQRREDERHDRAEAWAQRKRREIVYLGAGVSTALGKREGSVRPGLPELHDAAAIARAIGISVGELRFLTFHRKVSATTHWRRFKIPKKTGGQRLISAPMPRLKTAQRWVLEHVLEKLPVHEAAHGFVAGRSIVTNASAHVGQEVVVNLDLRDFFPTLTWLRVRGLFASLGFSPEASTIFALLCTEPEVDECEIDGRRWFVHRGERKLPQGSPCSPAITNAICVRLDQRLSGLARKLGLRYTRYADDLTFSGPAAMVKTVLGAARAIVEAEGFVVHPDKTRVMRKGERQEVTGLVVNRRLGVSRHHVRRWRAALFHARKDGPAGATFGRSPDVFASLHGFAAFVAMVEPDKGAGMLAEVGEVAAGHGWTPPRRPPPRVAPVTPAAPEVGEAPAPDKGKWWQFWKWFS
ncbi:MAG: reverse transcriptase family protein [Myxococcota bacterium]